MRKTYKNKRDFYNAQVEEAQRQVEDIRCLLAACQKKAESQSNPVTSQQVKWFCHTCRTVGGVL